MLDASTLRSKLQRTLQLELPSFGVSTAGGTSVSSVGGLGSVLETADKANVLQEARCFSASPVNALTCCRVITKILYLLQRGVSLSEEETSGLFFGLTRLFHSRDERLRRLLYLLLRCLPVSAAEGFVVTSCVTKDAADKNPSYRANALRCLSCLADAAIAAQTERYVRVALTDVSPLVSSAAMLCGLSLLSVSPETVRRWSGEVQGCLSSPSPFVAAHALLLLLLLKQGDKTAQIKAVAAAAQMPAKSPAGDLVLLRLAANLLQREADPKVHEVLLHHAESCLRSSNEMVVLEAARAICTAAAAAQQLQLQQQQRQQWQGYSRLLSYDMGPAFAALSLLCSSSRAAARYAATRTLSQLSAYPVCGPHLSAAATALEAVLGDSNKAAAATAVSVLLKTATETNIERLMRLVSSLMGDVSATDNLKLSLISSVLSLSLAYPKKHKSLLCFLSSCLREEGSVEVKTAAINTMLLLLQHIPAARDACLSFLCEFIEDCEFPSLCSRILCLLGDEADSWGCTAETAGAAAATKTSYLRYISNRIVLETSAVRAAGVDALAKVGKTCSSKRRDVLLLLAATASADPDDEVRDRAFALQQALEQQQQQQGYSSDASTDAGELDIAEMLEAKPPVSLECLCSALSGHLQQEETADTLFNATQLPPETEQPQQQQQKLLLHQAAATAPAATNILSGDALLLPPVAAAAPPPSSTSTAAAGVAAVAAKEKELLTIFESLTASAAGAAEAAAGGSYCLHASSPLQRLTEEEAEYGVEVVLHAMVPSPKTQAQIPKEASVYLLLEFKVSNTLEAQTLADVTPRLSAGHTPWVAASCLPIPLIAAGDSSSSYVLLTPAAGAAAAATRTCVSLGAALSFVLREEGDDFGCSDEYPIEAISITPAHFISRVSPKGVSFASLWESLEGTESLTKLSLPFASPAAAISGLLGLLQMAACDGTDVFSSSSSSSSCSHELLLSGVFAEGQQVLARALCLFPGDSCLLRLAVRSSDLSLCEALCAVLE